MTMRIHPPGVAGALRGSGWGVLRALVAVAWVMLMALCLTHDISPVWAVCAALLLASLHAARGAAAASIVVLIGTSVWMLPAVGVERAVTIGDGIFLVLLLGSLLCLPFWLAGIYYRESQETGSALEETESVAALARTEERRQLATELHNGIARDLEIIHRTVRLIDKDVVPADLPDLRQLSAEAVDGLAHLVAVLRKGDSVLTESSAVGSLDVSLQSAVDDAVARLRGSGLEVTVDVTAGLEPPDKTRLLLLRALGEGTTNILKHAPGAEVHLSLRNVDDKLVLDLANTVPADGPRLSSSGVGLTALDERVHLHGGEIRTGYDDEGRWHLRIEAIVAGEHVPLDGTSAG